MMYWLMRCIQNCFRGTVAMVDRAWSAYSSLLLLSTTTTILISASSLAAWIVPRRMASSRAAIIMASSSTTAEPPATQVLRFCDIGANLLDDRFTAGVYRGTPRHDPDLDLILQRAANVGVRRIVLTAGTVDESRRALDTARAWNNNAGKERQQQLHFASTVGVHPTRCQQVFVDNNNDPEALLSELLKIAVDGMSDGTVVAIGEIGLDYDRLEFCPKDVQQLYLRRQLERLAAPTGLPLFLHNRSTGDALYRILAEHQNDWKGGGVVHSFDDTLELATKFTEDLGLYIGLNGCSLRTEESLQTVKDLPLERILLETDCPYCEVRKTHPGYKYIQTHFPAKAEKKFERGLTVKSRQEPCHIVQVAEIVAGCKGLPLQQVADACYQNSLQLYGWKLSDDNDDDDR